MGRPIDLTAGGVRWRVGPGWLEGRGAGAAGGLFGPGGPRLAEWLASGQASVVKHGLHRTVYRVTQPGDDFHVKHYRGGAGTLGWVRRLARSAAARFAGGWGRLLGRGKALGEYDRTLAVAARGVPTLDPLAVGEGGDGGSYFLTRTLSGAEPLSAFLEVTLPGYGAARRARLRQRLAVALGHFLARMHQAGVTHRDLHPGNFLVRLGAGEEPEFVLIDLQAVDLGPPLGWPASRANLVILNRWFMVRAERSDRLRFWHAYEEARPELRLGCRREAPVGRERARDLERQTLASNLRFWRVQDRRSRGTNKYFRRIAHGELRGHAVADLDAAALAPLLADPDGLFARPDVTVLKDSPTSSVVEFDLPGPDGPRRVIYKRFAVASWRAPWAALLRPTPALRSFVLGHGLRLRCLPTPRPLAVWHRVRHGLPREGYLLTEKVPGLDPLGGRAGGAVDLLGFLAPLEGLPPGERLAPVRRLIEQVARLIRVLHARHLSHRDLKAANLLVSTTRWEVAAKGTRELGEALPGHPTAAAAAGAAEVWFIDLVGVRRHGKLRRGRRLQNLARLHASFASHPGLTRTDKLRFLRVYLCWGLRGRFGWKRWWRQIEEATRVKISRNLRNGRPLG